MAQIKRTEGIKRLTDGRVNVLVATDVAARGIDIPDGAARIKNNGVTVMDKFHGG
ncbi:helicase-related protein, partial [Enterobacter cloacae]|uniref:helicase-related protein n=1 Tax=Enterobacter cloacae TaxID=550 RepID=UPI0032AF1324